MPINKDEFYEQNNPIPHKPKVMIEPNIHHIQLENEPKTATNEYIKLENYRAHWNTDPSQLHFGEINSDSLCGIIFKISNINDNNLQKYYVICDSMSDCIGFSIHPTIGILFHSHTAYPLQYIRNWNFYIKNISQNEKYEMKQFTNQRINYTMDLISTSNIPSLFALDLAYAVPIIARQFMTFEWNLGRVNNQLYSFEAVLQYSVIYLRTIILPFTTHRNHELGTQINESLSIWDMMKLSEFVDYIFEHELVFHSIPNMTEYVIINNNDIDYENKTFNIELNSQDLKWQKYFNKSLNNNFSEIRNEPNWNMLSLLNYRIFTNNDHWKLGHENTIHNNWNDWQCYVSRGIRDQIPKISLNNCRLIHFSLGRYAHFKIDNWPIFDVLSFMIPAKRIRKAVDNHIKFWFEQINNYRIGVHRRAMKEGGKDSSGSPYVCRYKAKSLTHSSQYYGLRRHIENVMKNKFKNEMNQNEIDMKIKAIADLYDRTCATNYTSIQNVLTFHKQKPLGELNFWDNSIKEYQKRGKQMEPWFLACDNQEPDQLKQLIDKYGAFTLNGKNLADFWNGPLYWNMAKELEIEQAIHAKIVEKQYLKYLKIFQQDELKREHNEWKKIINDGHKPRWWYEMSKIEFWRKEIVVFDMWMLKYSQFFVGSWHSTLTRNVCHWRGYENMYNSSNCYLVHKWRAMYENDIKPPIDGDYPLNWFDVTAVDKPLLVWKDGQ